MNYLTAQFALAERGQVREGETVLVHGAAGGVGTATLQVAKGFGARTIARGLHRRRRRTFARAAGADETVLARRVQGRGRATLTGGRGVDVVVDVVGGDAVHRLAALPRPSRAGCWSSASPPARASPRSRSTGCCSNNVDVRGVGWGAYAMARPGYMREQWDALLPMMESGVVEPPVGATYDLDGLRPGAAGHGDAPHPRQDRRARAVTASRRP